MLTYTIYDADPAVSGPCAWPDFEDIEIDANPCDALAKALRVAEHVGMRCGEYNAGDRLFVLVWNEAGTIVASGSIILTR